MAICWTANGYKNHDNRYKKLVEIQSQSISTKKKEEYTQFTPEYINKIFGLEDNPKSTEEHTEKDAPSFKGIFSQEIPKHLFQKPRKTQEYYIKKAMDSGKDFYTNDQTENKDNSSFFQTPKMALVPKDQEFTTLKKKFTVKKKIKNRMYEKETISFSAKIVQKPFLQSLQSLPMDSTVKKNSFIIKTKQNAEEIKTPVTATRQFREKSKTIQPQIQQEKIFKPLRNFVIKVKNEVNSNRAEAKTASENPERSGSNLNLTKILESKFRSCEIRVS